MELYLCTTPLQVRIAQAISKKRKIKNKLVYVMDIGSYTQTDEISLAKQKTYINECDEFFLWSVPNYTEDLKKIIGTYDAIFVASLDNAVLEDIIKKSQTKHVFGFDDGYASVYEKGIYTREAADYLKNRIEKHYTIYQTHFHVIAKEKLEYLPIEEVFNFPKERPKNNKTLTLFLGEEILADPEKGLNFNQTYVDVIKPDFYIPHPRAIFKINYKKITNQTILFEEMLAEWLMEYEKIDVYHFSSSAALHLGNVEGVTFHGILIKPLEQRQLEMMKEGVQFERIPLTSWF